MSQKDMLILATTSVRFHSYFLARTISFSAASNGAKALPRSWSGGGQARGNEVVQGKGYRGPKAQTD